jgi:signal transduction histidine kinase/CheY-like chemotaxis protein
LLGVLLMTSNYCMTHCRQWQRTACLCLVVLVGPYSELAATHHAYLTMGPAAPEYSVIWLDNFVFSLIMEVSISSIATTLGVPFRMYTLLVLSYLPAGICWAFVLQPAWAQGTSLCGVLLALALVASVSNFVGQDLTTREFAEKEKAHERYIAALSHDFGTPISALQMATTQLREHVFSAPSPVETGGAGLRAPTLLFDGMDAALELMAALKRKAIDIGKLNLGEALNPERTPCRLPDLMAKLEAMARYMPHNERVSTKFFVSGDIAEVVSTDASWCFMILLNLLSNAFKATQLGSITVSARLTAGHIRFTVADTGVGLSSTVERNLWKAFKQSSRWASGTGLGLYHVYHLANALGGSVGYQPNILEGSGACFWVDVPYVPIEALEPSSGATPTEGHHAHGETHAGTHAGIDDYRDAVVDGLTTSTGGAGGPTQRPSGLAAGAPPRPGGTVLLAEDNMFMQELTADLIRSTGVTKVVCACNGEDALNALTASDAPDFSLVLMDVQMPFMDGIECTRRVRAWEQQAGRPTPLRILALSANGADAACIRDCKAAGMDEVLSKPISRRTLCGLLGVSASNPPSCTASNSSTPTAATKATPPPTATLSQGARRSASSGWGVQERIGRGDEASATARASVRADAMPSQAKVFDLGALLGEHGEAHARTLVAAFQARGTQPLDDLLAALERGDAPAAQNAAHTLKGVSAFVGASAMRATAATIELAAKEVAIGVGGASSPAPALEVAKYVATLHREFERLVQAHTAFLARGPVEQPMGAASAFSPDAASRC